MQNEIPLFVDLDGTIIKEDIGYIALKHKLRENIFNLFVIFFKLVFYGRPSVKFYISANYKVKYNQLAFNKSCLRYIKDEKNKGRKVFLISGSHDLLIKQFQSKLNNFDGFFGTHNNYNMISENKVSYIRNELNYVSFDYIGNSFQDLKVWEYAENTIYTNVSEALLKKIALLKKNKICIKADFFNI